MPAVGRLFSLVCTRIFPETQAEPEQISVPVQAVPQAPQFNLFDVKFTQLSLQFVNVVSVQAQTLFEQDIPVGQTVPHAPQLALSEAYELTKTHLPPQSAAFEAQSQLPPVHTSFVPHAVPQVPQLAASVNTFAQVAVPLQNVPELQTQEPPVQV